MKIIASNKKAYFNFEIIDQIESGIVLEGWEVKSVKLGRFDIGSAYIKERNGELFLINSSIPSYIHGFEKSKDIQIRDRKLLLKRSEINKILLKLKQSGITLIPLEAYINDANIVKLAIALVRGRKKTDKRSKIKERDLKRRVDIERKKYNF